MTENPTNISNPLKILLRTSFISAIIIAICLNLPQIRRLKSGWKGPPSSGGVIQQQPQGGPDCTKRIFVSQNGSPPFSIVVLRGESYKHWQVFLQEACQAFQLPRDSKVRIQLAEVDAEVTSPTQLQANDKVILQLLA